MLDIVFLSVLGYSSELFHLKLLFWRTSMNNWRIQYLQIQLQRSLTVNERFFYFLQLPRRAKKRNQLLFPFFLQLLQPLTNFNAILTMTLAAWLKILWTILITFVDKEALLVVALVLQETTQLVKVALHQLIMNTCSSKYKLK